MLEIRFSQPGDAEYIAKNLRREDEEEVRALGCSPYLAVAGSVNGADVSYTGVLDGKPVMVFGLSLPGWQGGAGEIWALGTPECNRIAVSMVKRSRKIVQEFLKICPVLENWCDARYTASLRWLRLLGFTVEEPEPRGVNGELFCHLIIRREDLLCVS